jgi:hypothetical protein
MTGHALDNTKVDVLGAISLYDSLHKESGRMMQALNQVLPLLNHPTEARELVMHVTGGDRIAMNHVRYRCGEKNIRTHQFDSIAKIFIDESLYMHIYVLIYINTC